MKEPDIKEITTRLSEYSQNLKDNNQIGNSKLILAIADMISVMAWTSHEQGQYSKTMVDLTKAIVILTIMLLLGLIAQIYIAQKQYYLTDVSSIADRIQQAQLRLRAEEFCRDNPNAEDSGLFFENGQGAPCSAITTK